LSYGEESSRRKKKNVDTHEGNDNDDLHNARYLCPIWKIVKVIQRNKIIVFLSVIRLPVSYLKHNVSETAICLRLQVKAYSFGPNRES
jgi:hypothetical protein